MFYLDMHAAHFKALEVVSKRVEAAKDLVNRVAEFEDGARALKKAVETERSAEYDLPGYPLAAGDTGWGPLTAEELTYLNDYYAAAARIANDAMAARSHLNRIIEGWDSVVDQAKKTEDFTRESAWNAVNQLDLRFQKDGSGFRAFLVDTRDEAGRVEDWARMKQYHAAYILGKWVPAWYSPPEAGSPVYGNQP